MMSEKKFYIFGDNIRGNFGEVDKPLNNTEIVDLLNELHEENERLKNKLNVTALELVDEAISMGKAVEISEMSYHEFLEYRQNKGKPMELQR